MRIILTLFLLIAPLFAATSKLPEPLPKSLPKNVLKKTEDARQRLMELDCPFLLQLYHPKETSESQLALCIHTETQERGIYTAHACVTALAEPDSRAVNPFYGKNGHWGVEGKCTSEQMKKKLKDPAIPTTVNPFTSFKLKQEAGFRVSILRDDLGLWEDVKPLIAPAR